MKILKEEYAVEVTVDGKTHIDTQYNGGFQSWEQAEDVAKHGYIKEAATRAVRRTIFASEWE